MLKNADIEKLLDYLKSNLEMFDTQPKVKFIPAINQNISCWRSTRLQLMRDGIEELSNSDLIVQYIQPNNAENGYTDGFFIITLDELEKIPLLQDKRQNEACYVEQGFYNWPKLPQVAEPFFYPI